MSDKSIRPASISEAASRVRAYLARHAKNRHGDPRSIHGYDIGEASEAELLVADLEALTAAPVREEGGAVDVTVQNAVAASMAEDPQWTEMSAPARAVLMLQICRRVSSAITTPPAPEAEKLRAAVEALKKIRDYRVVPASATIWTAAHACRDIANKALTALNRRGGDGEAPQG